MFGDEEMKKVGSRLLGLAATVMSILMLAPLMLVSFPAPAHAAGKVPPVKMTDGGTYYLDTGIHVSGKTFFGFERKKKDGRVYLCLENLAPPPKNLEYTGKDYTHRELAYLLWKYGEGLIGYGPSSSTAGPKKVKDSVKNANAKQLDAAAIAYIGKYDSKYNSKKKFPNGYYPKRVRDRAAKLRTEARNYMGPYTAQGSLKVKNEKQMELRGVGIKSKAGRWISGTDLKLHITGDATFAENGKKTITKKTTTKGMNLAVNRGKGTAKSDISVKVDGISGLPNDKIRIYNTERAKKSAKAAGQFAVGVRPGDVKRQKPSKTLKASFPSIDYQFKIETKQSHEVTDGEDTIIDARDEIKLSTVKGKFPKGAQVKIESSLYAYNTPTDRKLKKNGEKIGTVETVFTGPGTKMTPVVKVPKGEGNAGKYYVWYEKSPEVKHANGKIAAWNGNTVRPSESFDLGTLNYDNVVVYTETSNLNKDGEIHDNYAVSFEKDGTYIDKDTAETKELKADIQFDLYWTREDPRKAPLAGKNPADLVKNGSAEKVGTTTVKNVSKSSANAEGQLTATAPVKAAEKYHRGYLTWVATVSPSSELPGYAKEFVLPSTTEFGVPEETTFNKWTPEVVTKVQKPIISKGDMLVDIVTVSGIPEDEKSEIRYECIAWGPFKTAPEPGKPLPEDAEEHSRGVITVNKNGDYTCEAERAQESGYYVFTEKSHGDDRSNPTEDLTVYSEETTLVKYEPSVTTKAQDQVTELDENGKGKIADNVSVRGGHPGDTVEIAVYQNGPTLDKPAEGEQSLDVLRADNEKREKEGMPTRELPEKNNDSTVLPTQVHSVKLDENGNADFRTDDFEIDESGYYWFTYDLHSTDMTEPKSETEVIHEETTFVKWRPFVETVAQNQKLSFDESGTAEISDILRVWGLRPNSTVDIEVTANGPDVKGEVKNDEQTPENAPKVGSKVVSVTADAKGEALVKTEPFKVKKAGYYWFTYKHEGDDNTTKVEDRTKYARETSFVYFQPKVRTVAEKQEVKLKNGKAQIRDTMHVSEGRPGDTVTIKVCVAGGDTTKPTPTGDQKKPGILYTSQGVVEHSDTPEIPDAEKKDDDKKSEKRTDLGAPREMPKSNNCKDVEVKLDDKGEATVKTEPFEVNKVGYYYFTYSSEGNGNTDRFEDGNIYEEETVFVSENPVAGGIADAPEVVKEAAKAVPGMSSKTGGAGLPIALLIAGILLAAGGTASVVKSKKSKKDKE